MMMPVRHPFSAFTLKIRHYSEKINPNYIHFDSLNTPFHHPKTHDSNIPEFQHSNWGEAPSL
jgi:hypothetical protein